MHLRFLKMTNHIHSILTTTSSSSAVADIVTTTTTTISPLLQVLQYDTLISTFISNPLMVGTAWMISSAIFTTYSTTKFIKYNKSVTPSSSSTSSSRSSSSHTISILRQKFMERYQRLLKTRRQQQQIRFFAEIMNHNKNNRDDNDRILHHQTTRTSTSNIPHHSSSSSSSSSSHVQQIQQQPTVLVRRPRLSPSSRLTMYRFAGSLLLGLLFSSTVPTTTTGIGSSTATATTTLFLIMNNVWCTIQQRLYDTIAAIPILLIPSIFLFIANFSNTIALDRIGIGLTYTSKCGIPIITVLLTLLLDGVTALPNLPTLLSLVPIAIGIAAASWSAPTYELLGFIMASISATAQSALNVTSKRALAKANLTGPVGQRTMVAVGLLFTVTINMIQIIRTTKRQQNSSVAASQPPFKKNDTILHQESGVTTTNVNDVPPLWLTVMAMTAYHVEYLLSFIFVTLVGPVTYGACDAIRRLCIILFGRIFFGGDPFTTTNKIGIVTAVCGALCYSVLSSKR